MSADVASTSSMKYLRNVSRRECSLGYQLVEIVKVS